MGKQVIMDKLPMCDLCPFWYCKTRDIYTMLDETNEQIECSCGEEKCGKKSFEARYDAKTKQGPWAYVCQKHWERNTPQVLGTGYGQKLILEEENDET